MYEHLRLKNSFVLVCFMVILILRIIIEIEVIKKKIKFALSPVKITNTQEMNQFIWWLKYKYQRLNRREMQPVERIDKNIRIV